ncbi:AAA family ATPase [Methyloceanibacter sp.]|uniref:bifunctional aminoglycoside phosphotransferase/ATP-binding protein n=1 Tax=Methyloceanibacter sp. TaxID=1965321 RepID=UPI002D23B079|nr:AAA family ATPase [Methyloceanibacter sp.]HZP09485.1 AAA family ATPase [Methyloceanibacter sp.]
MTGVQEDQGKVLEFLALPKAYPDRPRTVERIETHASVVFLAGDFAYKVKRAVKYPFLDFSTLEKRRLAAENELRINRRTAPGLYLDVLPVTLGPQGRLALGGTGEVVEWVLRMRRFDQRCLYERMAEEGRLELAAMRPLAETIAAFHADAARSLTVGQWMRQLGGILDEHERMLGARPDLFPAEEAKGLIAASRAAFADLLPLIESRSRGGFVRHCHGDLHLRNIVEIEAKPVLFDAIEFDDALATIDVLYDLAFLVMDLGKRKLAGHANAVLNAYLDADGSSGNLLGLAALPLFLSLRAMIRAKVETLRAGAAEEARDEAEGEARNYFALARAFLQVPDRPKLIAIGGLSGSGKSAVAAAISPRLGAFPGAVHVRSDVERKRLFGVSPEVRLPAEAYLAGISDEVYAICRKRARFALRSGRTVMVDAVHAKPEERAAIEALAAEEGVPFTGLWLEAPREVMRARVAKRLHDASDATPSVVDEQLRYEIGPQNFELIDAGLPLAQVAHAALEAIGAAPNRTA